MPTQFNLVDLRVLRVNYSFSPKKRKRGKKLEASSPLPVDLQCRSVFEENKLILKSILAVSVQTHDFSLDVEFGGVFKFEKAPDETELDKLRNINCPAIVFPFLREFVADLVRRGGFDSLLLPPVNFVRMYEDKKAEEANGKQNKIPG